MFITGLLGMQLFGYKVAFCDSVDGSQQLCPPGAECPDVRDCYVPCDAADVGTWFPVSLGLVYSMPAFVAPVVWLLYQGSTGTDQHGAPVCCFVSHAAVSLTSLRHRLLAVTGEWFPLWWRGALRAVPSQLQPQQSRQ